MRSFNRTTSLTDCAVVPRSAERRKKQRREGVLPQRSCPETTFSFRLLMLVYRLLFFWGWWSWGESNPRPNISLRFYMPVDTVSTPGWDFYYALGRPMNLTAAVVAHETQITLPPDVIRPVISCQFRLYAVEWWEVPYLVFMHICFTEFP